MSESYLASLAQELQSTRKVCKATTLKYIRLLVKLNGGPFTDLGFLYDTAAVHTKLAPLEESTRAGYYGTILAITKAKKMKKSLIRHYEEIFTTLRKIRGVRTDIGEKTESQATAWLEWDEVLKAVKCPTLTPVQRLVGALYTMLPPRRNADYLHLQLDSGSGNWVDLSGGVLHFTNYKTAKQFGHQTVQAPPELITLIQDFVGSVGLTKGDYFFGTKRSPSQITRLLNSIFKRKIGPTMLRHIYLTSKYADKKDEMKKDANIMAHSTGMQSAYIVS